MVKLKQRASLLLGVQCALEFGQFSEASASWTSSQFQTCDEEPRPQRRDMASLIKSLMGSS